MPNIKPILDLRNHNELLQASLCFGPKMAEKNFAIFDINEYDKLKALLKLRTQLAQGEQAGREQGWMTVEEVEAELGIENV